MTAAIAAVLAFAGTAAAEHCLNMDALGTARVLALDPATLERAGTMQYRATLPLAPKEIVLTFDDGPMPPMTASVLDALRRECVRATFFLVGRNARAHPAIVRQIAGEGHTVANHSENHYLVAVGGARGVQELDKGNASIAGALAPAGIEPAPFFRFPGLLNTHAVESHAKRRGVTVMSADFVADDWRGIRPEHIVARALARIQAKGSGILLLHDVQPALALALPALLQELKKRGYRIVHLVAAPGSGTQPLPGLVPVAETKVPPHPRKPARPVRRATPAPAELESAKIFVWSRWRKRFESEKPAATKAAFPGYDNGGH